MPETPSSPDPVIAAISTVSAWSSSVCATATRAAPLSRSTRPVAARRTSRAHCSGDISGSRGLSAVSRWNGTRSFAAARSTYAPSFAESRRIP